MIIGLHFDPPIETKKDWENIIYAIKNIMPEVKWSSGGDLEQVNLISTSIVWDLFIRDNKMSYSTKPRGFEQSLNYLSQLYNSDNLVNGREYLGLDINIEDIFNSLNESEEDGFDWAREIINSGINIPFPDGNNHLYLFNGKITINETLSLLNKLQSLGWQIYGTPSYHAKSISKYSESPESYIFLKANKTIAYGKFKSTFESANRLLWDDIHKIYYQP